MNAKEYAESRIAEIMSDHGDDRTERTFSAEDVVQELQWVLDRMTGKTYVATEVYDLVIQDIHLFSSEEEADEWFKEYTGLDYGTLYDEHGECVKKEYDETKIFILG